MYKRTFDFTPSIDSLFVDSCAKDYDSSRLLLLKRKANTFTKYHSRIPDSNCQCRMSIAVSTTDAISRTQIINETISLMLI